MAPRAPDVDRRSTEQSPNGASFTELRRSKLTQIGLLADRAAGHNNVFYLCVSAVITVAYVIGILPQIASFGVGHGSAFTTTSASANPPCATVSWAYALVISCAYVSWAIAGMYFMQQRRSPVNVWVFEYMTIHYITQCLLNIFCVGGFILELRVIWFGGADTRTHLNFGSLIWLQYHCRQLQLLDTAFTVLRNKFEGISFLHLYLRVLNLWGWFIACRLVPSNDVLFPALVSSVCQGAVYGLYFCSSISLDTRRALMSRTTRIAQLNITQYIVCAFHSAFACVWGTFPFGLAMLHLFAIANGLVFYTNFHSERPKEMTRESTVNVAAADKKNTETENRRVTFSFDSCGWLMVYHFGVGAWLTEYLGLQPGESPKGIAFSGSSGGALIATVLAAGMNPSDVFNYVLEQYPACQRDPREMFPAVERALRRYAYEGAHKHISGRLRVLLTRVGLRPPFVMGEIVGEYPDNETAIQTLCASCHVPLFAGLLPRRVGKGYYYDGLAWPSRLLVPWRGAKGDHVVRVSACGSPLADLALCHVPKWWGGLPPNEEILRGLFWCGYRDAARWFCQEPQLSIDCCVSRRRGRNDTESSTGDANEEVSRWLAARALLKGHPSKLEVVLPKMDPTTGADVSKLIERAELMAARENRSCKRAVLAAAAAVGVAAVAVAAQQFN